MMNQLKFVILSCLILTISVIKTQKTEEHFANDVLEVDWEEDSLDEVGQKLNKNPIATKLISNCGKTKIANNVLKRTNENTMYIGGNVSNSNTWPWICAVFIKLTNENGTTGYNFLCASTIINNVWLLSASKRIDTGVNPEDLYVVCGHQNIAKYLKVNTNMFSNPANYFAVDKIIRNPTFGAVLIKISYNDTNYIKFSKTQQPICLASTSSNTSTGLIAGWGANTFGGAYSALLKDDQVPIVPYTECVVYGDPMLAKCTICAGSAGHSTCDGDAGGPMVTTDSTLVKFTQIAILSDEQCGSGDPILHLAVSCIFSWVIKAIKSN